MQAFPLGEGAERREAEEVFHAGRPFPEWDHVESKSPSSGFAALTHLPPQGEGMRRSTVVKPSPQGEGSRFECKPSPHEARSAGCSAFSSGEGGPKGRKRCSAQGVSSPNGTMLKASPPSSGLAALTHLPPQGEGSRFECKPSPHGARSAGCRGHPRAVARRAGRGVPRRASLPRMGKRIPLIRPFCFVIAIKRSFDFE